MYLLLLRHPLSLATVVVVAVGGIVFQVFAIGISLIAACWVMFGFPVMSCMYCIGIGFGGFRFEGLELGYDLQP